MTRTAPRTAAALPPLAALLLLALTTHVAFAADVPQRKGRKVNEKELMEAGLFQDVAELDLEKLLHPDQSTVGIASARPVRLERAPGAVTVFRSEDIRTLGARTLEDLLRLTPGFDVTTDSLGRTRITVRGILAGTAHGGSPEILILLDGVRLNEDILGGATIVNLDLQLAHVRQVEILRGPAASLYGDGALAGVINIVSQTTDDIKGTELEVGGGSWRTQDYTLRSGGLLGGLAISGYLRYGKTRGARELVAEDAQTLADAGRVEQGLAPISLAPAGVRDAKRALDAAYSFRFRDWTLAFRTKTEKSDGFLGPAEALGRQNDLNNNQLLLDALYAPPAGRWGTFKARASFLRNEIRDLLEFYPSGYQLSGDFGTILFGPPGGNGGVFQQTSFNERRFTCSLSFDRDLGTNHQLSASLRLQRDATFDLGASGNLDLRTLTPVPAEDPASSLAPLPGAVQDARRTTFSVLAEDAWSPSERLSVTFGASYDHLSDVAQTLNPRVALVASPTPSVVLKLLYARAFRAPTFRERLFDLPGGAGNPGLRLVKADGLELGGSFTRGRFEVGLRPFLELVGGAITTAVPAALGTLPPFENGRGERAAGFELEGRYHFALAGSVFLNYTYQHTTLRETGEPAPGLPSELLNLGAILDIHGRFSLAPSLAVRGGRLRDASDARPPLPGYAVFGLTARGRRLLRTLDVVLAAENLFGKDHRDPSPPGGVPGDYPRPGRRILVHAAFRF